MPPKIVEAESGGKIYTLEVDVPEGTSESQLQAIVSQKISSPSPSPSVTGQAVTTALNAQSELSAPSTMGQLSKPALSAGAQFGESALFGIPSRTLAGASAIGGEVGEFFGGEPEPFRERLTTNLEDYRDVLFQAGEESPAASGIGDVAGLFLSPVNKLKAVQGLFKVKGAAGVAGRSAFSAGVSGGQSLGKGSSVEREELENAALISAAMDSAVFGLGKFRKPAQDIFQRLTGIKATDIRQASKGLRIKDKAKARDKFTKAFRIIKDEHGIKTSDLAKSDEKVLESFTTKAIDSIESRNSQIDDIITEADKVLPKGFKIKITDEALERVVQKTPEAQKAKVRKAGRKFIDAFNDSAERGLSLGDVQTEKKALGRLYKPEQAYLDGVSGAVTSFKEAIENRVEHMVGLKLLPKEYSKKITAINKEQGPLIELRDALLKKLPGAQAQDILSKGQRSVFTTGGSGAPGAAYLGKQVAGDEGAKVALTAAMLAYSNRIQRPLAHALSEGNIANFLASPELRSALTGLVETDEGVDVNENFNGNTGAVDDDPLRSISSEPTTAKKKTMSDLYLTSDKFVDAIIKQESAGDPKALGPELTKGRGKAQGLMQVIPKTWDWIGKDILGVDPKKYNPFDKEDNKKFGKAYLGWLGDYWERKKAPKELIPKLVLASYNHGQGAVSNITKKHGYNWYKIYSDLPGQTKAYIHNITQDLYGQNRQG